MLFRVNTSTTVDDDVDTKVARTESANCNFDLGGKKKLGLSSFKGKLLVDIREYYTSPNGEEFVILYFFL